MDYLAGDHRLRGHRRGGVARRRRHLAAHGGRRCRPASTRGRPTRSRSSTARATSSSASWRPPSSGRCRRSTDPDGGAPRRAGLPVQQRHLRGPERRRRPDLEPAGGGGRAPVRRPAQGSLRDHARPGHRHLPRPLPDGPPNPNYGSLYEVWTRYYPAGQFPGEPTATGGSDIMFAVSHDGGQTWQLQLEPLPGTGVLVTVIQNYSEQRPGRHRRPRPRELVARHGRAGRRHLRLQLPGRRLRRPALDRRRQELCRPRPRTNGRASLRHQRYRPLPSPVWPPITSAPRPSGPSPPTRPGRGRLRRRGDPGRRPAREHAWTRATSSSPAPPTTASPGRPPSRSAPTPPTSSTTTTTARAATGTTDDVTGGQALPRLVIDAQGNIAVIWYDTRRDPADHLLDVFGTVSTDGGQTFSPNFRVTDQSFDANAGKFTDATGQDRLLPGRLPRPGRGQRHGLRRLDRHPQRQPGHLLHPLPDQPRPGAAQRPLRAQRHRPPTATDLGRVVTRRPAQAGRRPRRRGLVPVQGRGHRQPDGDGDRWPSPGDSLHLELYDASGTTLLASGTARARRRRPGHRPAASSSRASRARPTWCASCPAQRPWPAHRPLCAGRAVPDGGPGDAGAWRPERQPGGGRPGLSTR